MIIRPPKDYSKRMQVTLKRLERWSLDYGVSLEHIPTQEATKTADFRAIFPDSERTNVIIEVKEIAIPFEINKEEVIEVCEAGPPDGRFQSADAVRRKIRAARDQLKPYADTGCPTLLLLGMWSPALDVRLDWDIPIAMLGGGPRISLNVNGLPMYEIVSTARGGRQAADNTNRSISAVGRFERGKPNLFPETLVVYRHNNPRVQLDVDLPGIQYVM